MKSMNALRVLFAALIMLYIPLAMAQENVMNLPQNIKLIKAEAFYGLTGIDTVVLPEGVEEIQSLAFAQSAISAMNLPASLSYIAEDAFDGCSENVVFTVEANSYALNWCEANGYEYVAHIVSSPASDFTYAVYEDHIGITGYTGDDTKICIPGTIEGLPVTVIENEAFRNCKNLISVTVPEGAIEIGKHAFDSCSSLNSVMLPDSLNLIDEYAFYGCSSLTRIVIPEQVTHVGYMAFCMCRGLVEVVLPDSVVNIGEYAFGECSSLKQFSIPSGISNISNRMLERCSSLESIVIPESIISIGWNSFAECAGLKGNLVIPDSVVSIGESAFYGCSGLDGSLVLSDSLISIGRSAFEGCSGLSGELILPLSLREIGNRAFYGCWGFTGNLILPNSLEKIGSLAFERCSRLDGYVVWPDGITTIPNSCFYNCNRIKAVYAKSVDLIEQYAFIPDLAPQALYLGTELQYNSMFAGDSRVRYIDFENNRLLDQNGELLRLAPSNISMSVEKNDNDSFDGKVTHDVKLSIQYDYDGIMDLIQEDIEFETVKVNNPSITIIAPDYIAEEYELNAYQKQTLTVDGQGDSKVQCEQTGYFGDEFTFKVTFMSEVVQNDPVDVRFVFSSEDDYTVEDAEVSVVFPKVYDAETTYFSDYAFSNEYASVNGNMAIQEGTTVIEDGSQVKVQGDLYISGGTLEINSGYLRCSRLVISDDGALKINGGSITAYDSTAVDDNGILEMHGGSLVSYGMTFDSNVDHTGKLTDGFVNVVGNAALGRNFHASGGHALRISGTGTMDVDEHASLASVQIVVDVLDFTLTQAFDCASFCFSKSTLGKMVDDAKQIIEALKYALNIQTVEQTGGTAGSEEEMYALQMGYLTAVPLGTTETTKEAWRQAAKKALSMYTAELMSETNEYKISTMQGLSAILYQTTKQKTYAISDYAVTIKPVAGLKLSSTIAGAGVIDLYAGDEKVRDFIYTPNEAGMKKAVEEYTNIVQNELYAVFKKEFNNALTDGIPGGKYLNTLLGMYEDSLFSEEKLKATLKNYAAGKVDEAVLSRLPNFKKFSSFYSKYRSAFVDASQIASGKYDGGTSMKSFLNDVIALANLVY